VYCPLCRLPIAHRRSFYKTPFIKRHKINENEKIYIKSYNKNRSTIRSFILENNQIFQLYEIKTFAT